MTKIFEIKFNGVVSLDLIENFFKEKSIKSVRWAIIKVENTALTISCAMPILN